MWRALQLARNGEGRVSPNPMVGAVIVFDDLIIGEGFHAFFGGPHAEVNAINSVSPYHRHLLKESTIYVTLEPCAHFGKTPPCANLIVKTGIPKVIIGSRDPNPMVAGKGIEILRNAGIAVESSILDKENRELNRRFFKYHTDKTPWIILKWAQSADGFMAALNEKGLPQQTPFSHAMSKVWMHRERSKVDVISVGKNTELIDSPHLDVREWGGNSPKKISTVSKKPLKHQLDDLAKEGVSSIMVEGGPTLLTSFIREGLYDEIRIETSPLILHAGLKAPYPPQDCHLTECFQSRNNYISIFRR